MYILEEGIASFIRIESEFVPSINIKTYHFWRPEFATNLQYLFPHIIPSVALRL
jgi:hypothetical protein